MINLTEKIILWRICYLISGLFMIFMVSTIVAIKIKLREWISDVAFQWQRCHVSIHCSPLLGYFLLTWVAIVRLEIHLNFQCGGCRLVFSVSVVEDVLTTSICSFGRFTRSGLFCLRRSKVRFNKMSDCLLLSTETTRTLVVYNNNAHRSNTVVYICIASV